MSSGWVSDVLARIPGVSDVANALGMGVIQRGGGASITPCPSCGAEKRGKHDPRGPVGIRPSNDGWRCHRCGTSGDAINLIAWHLCGARLKGMGERSAEVREWCASRGWCESADVKRAPMPASLPVKPASPTPPIIHRPPPKSIAEVWRICERQPLDGVHLGAVRVVDDANVAGWLSLKRKIDAHAVSELNLARALPVNAALPSWARWRGPWTATGHRLITPLFDAGARPASIHARSIDPAARLKALSPRGFAVAGLVMANAAGRRVLAAGPEATPPSALVIVEGLPDWLYWSALRPDLAFLGVISGSWSPDLAARIPSGTTITIRTHADPAGEKYARLIHASLANRCTVLRARTEQVIHGRAQAEDPR
jgi:hypothetical protein